MPSCDMCGAEGKLVRASVEGTELNVCSSCAKFGKVMKKPVTFLKNKNVVRETAREEKPEIIVPDYSSLIKKKREERGMKQEELARAIAEKESLIHKIEAGQTEPSISLARKLERFLKITLVKEFEGTDGTLPSKTKTQEFTIGDLVRGK